MNSIIMNRHNILIRIFRFYLTGFKAMTVGRTLWKIIFIKLIIMFGVLKFFFFPDFLQTNFTTDRQRADYVFEQITLQAGKHTQENRR